MIGRFFAARDPTEAPAVPAGTRVYAIGDIHGRADLLAALKALIHEDAYRRQAPRNVAVYLGDYVDRGPDSKGVVEALLREPLPGFESVHLKGNHEAILLRFLEDIGVAPSWLAYGGRETLESYGIAPPDRGGGQPDLLRVQRELKARLPREHLEFFRGLPINHVEGDFVFVHAGMKPGVPLEQQDENDMIWIREEFLESDASFGRIVVHGHTISPEPDVRRNRIGIDTGAYRSDRLTALVIEGSEWFFLQT